MAKKDNFDFQTESKFKLNLNFKFLENLTEQQRKTILISSIAAVVVIAIVVACIIIGLNGGFGGNNGNGGAGNSGGSSSGEESGNDIDFNAEPTQIYVSNMPSKTTYYVDDAPDYSGLVIGVIEESSSGFQFGYDDYPEKLEITGFDSSAPVEEQVITVKYREYTCSFKISISARPDESTGTLTKISMKTLPRTKYYLVSGRLEAFDPTGGIILCEYSDGSTKEVELEIGDVVDYSSITAAGEYTLTIHYFDKNGGDAETTLAITVVEIQPSQKVD